MAIINPKILAFYKYRVDNDKQTIDSVPAKYQDAINEENTVTVEQFSTPDAYTPEFTTETATTESLV